MTTLWILLLVLIIFIMYIWSNGLGGSAAKAPGCSACGKKNVPAVE